MKMQRLLLGCTGLLLSHAAVAELCVNNEALLADLQFEQLMQLEVTSASFRPEKLIDAPSSVLVVTQQMIQQRGYQTLIEIAEDLPGFDFSVFEDSGGELTTYNRFRGLGDQGNNQLLIMVDGIVQNSISDTWSTLWRFESILPDLERIEFIQGPGSALYGAQAATGVIHFITKSAESGVQVTPYVGQDNTRGLDLIAGCQLASGVNMSLAYRRYKTDGDGGLRYDPAGYFTGNRHPLTLTEEYLADGSYVTNIANPRGGERINDGFATHKDYQSVRGKISYQGWELGGFFWQYEEGAGSYLTAYEYDATGDQWLGAKQGYHLYLNNNWDINAALNLTSSLVYRATETLPETGFRYLYRFIDLSKTFRQFDQQTYLEERLDYQLNEQHRLLFGVKVTASDKADRVISLQPQRVTRLSTSSSWSIADAGNGLNQFEAVPQFDVNEQAYYVLLDSQYNGKWSSSLGYRHDRSSEFGSISNPRVSVIYKPLQEKLAFKFLYGSAFRQPSIFELRSSFRGNPDLQPEEIDTYELEVSSTPNDALLLRANVFYTQADERIAQVTNANGERRNANVDEFNVRGLVLNADYQLSERLHISGNYAFTQGKDMNTEWGAIDNTAPHKLNAIVNYAVPEWDLNFNLRANLVGTRMVSATNRYFATHFASRAPGYLKFNLAATYSGFESVSLQLRVKNLFDKEYYGLGRDPANSLIDDYDFVTTPNPPGFIPAYHPQPGRTWQLAATFRF